MSDIFISYASEDLQRAKLLAEALAAEGWSVWWDRKIEFGRPSDVVIEQNLNAARCVIVLWTRNSVISEWVKTEAAEGARRKILIPVLMDDVLPPLEFRRPQPPPTLCAFPAALDKVVVSPDEGVRVRAWVASPAGEPLTRQLVYVWTVTAGRIGGQAAAARWHLKDVAPGNTRRA